MIPPLRASLSLPPQIMYAIESPYPGDRIAALRWAIEHPSPEVRLHFYRIARNYQAYFTPNEATLLDLLAGIVASDLKGHISSQSVLPDHAARVDNGGFTRKNGQVAGWGGPPSSDFASSDSDFFVGGWLDDIFGGNDTSRDEGSGDETWNEDNWTGSDPESREWGELIDQELKKDWNPQSAPKSSADLKSSSFDWGGLLNNLMKLGTAGINLWNKMQQQPTAEQKYKLYQQQMSALMQKYHQDAAARRKMEQEEAALRQYYAQQGIWSGNPTTSVPTSVPSVSQAQLAAIQAELAARRRPPEPEKDNTLLYVGLAAAGVYIFMQSQQNQRRSRRQNPKKKHWNEW